jgi:hypothetical protein
MRRRYLFDPLTAEFADDKLRRHRESEGCPSFNARGDTDRLVGPALGPVVYRLNFGSIRVPAIATPGSIGLL